MKTAEEPSLVGVLQLAEALTRMRSDSACPFCAAMYTGVTPPCYNRPTRARPCQPRVRTHAPPPHPPSLPYSTTPSEPPAAGKKNRGKKPTSAVAKARHGAAPWSRC
eukprot:2185033-Rhodomonas_salina.2